MSSVCLIDTSIFLNLLDVPYCNESMAEVVEEFKTFVEAGCTFLLPMATILETGNHIAQNGDGNLRRKTAQLSLRLKAHSLEPPLGDPLRFH
jgi:hypothetical protein